MHPLVSIVVPTFPGREELLLERCLPSIQSQMTEHDLQVVVVSDRNEALAEEMKRAYGHITFVQINESWRNEVTEKSIGAVPWYVGSLLALGEFVGFCGDDDELLPDHVERHVEAMTREEAHFSISQIEFRAGGVPQFNVGDSFAHGHLDATGIMCHKDALQVANWTANGENAADWRLVCDWVNKGLRGTILSAPHTGIHHDGWLTGSTGRPDRPHPT